MKEKWIAWDWQPDYEWFDAEQKAIEWCKKALRETADEAKTEGWPEEMESFGIGYARVAMRTVETDRRPMEDGDPSEFDYICDYELREVTE